MSRGVPATRGLVELCARYWHTLRHLRAVQFYGRLWFRLVRPLPDVSPSPAQRIPEGVWAIPAARARSLTGPEEFIFLDEPGRLGDIGWNGPEREKLWRYNQHYFDDLNAAGRHERADWHFALLERWVSENPPGTGDGWEPYPTSLRIVNWVKWALAGNTLPESCIHSLAIQARWLCKRLEIHILGNHLFANAKALCFVGAFFEGPEADRWLSKGLSILRREIPEQILDDGGHFERSTMYHVLATEDMLDLLNLFQACPGLAERVPELAEWRGTTRKMLGWLKHMSHPDGHISFFNDAAFGIAPANSTIFEYAARLGLTAGSHPRAENLIDLSPSGYVVGLMGPEGQHKLLMDVAPVGPDYLPGHAHADSLSFELSLFGQRVIVNSGTSLYGLSSERLRQRGTSAHNTVEVDQEDSSEVWSGFRVARRARATLEVCDSHGSGFHVQGVHDGYRRLGGKNIHRRVWQGEPGKLFIRDTVTGPYTKAVARLFIHPDVEPDRKGDGIRLRLGGGELAHVQFNGEESVRIVESSWHPRFGESIRNKCIEVEVREGVLETIISWGNNEGTGP